MLAAQAPVPESVAGPERNEAKDNATTTRPGTGAADEPAPSSAIGSDVGDEASRQPEPSIPARRGWVCDGASRIEDGSDSRWTVSKVSFLAEKGYERIILHLDRAGLDRGDPPTVTAEVMPAAKVARRFPSLRRPGVGRSAVVLDLQDGIKATLGLRGYRPRGLATLKEFSAFGLPDGSSRLFISTASDGCFRLRIPSWTDGARNGTAQIQLDVKS